MTAAVSIAIVLLAIWLAYEALKGGRATGDGRQDYDGHSADISTRLPEELRSAKLWAKERQFACKRPVSLVGRIDEAFETRDGVIVVSDTKTRKRRKVYASDVLTVSAYGTLIRNAKGRKVSTTGYVRLVTPEGNEYREIDLLPDEEVAAATQLYQDLAAGKYRGEKCGKPHICRTCAYKDPCDSTD